MFSSAKRDATKAAKSRNRAVFWNRVWTAKRSGSATMASSMLRAASNFGKPCSTAIRTGFMATSTGSAGSTLPDVTGA